MNFTPPLLKGKLLKRYKRFFADVELDGEVVVAHVPNTGSLKTVPLTDTDCLISKSDDPKRKLKYTLEFIKTDSGLAGTNTRTPNTITHEALAEGLNTKFDFIQPEVKISDKTRIDFVLWTWLGKKEDTPKKLKYPDYLNNKDYKLHFIEVKNVTMSENQTAMFPDGVTERGTKHLNELMEMQKAGHSTEILFTIQRENIKNFKPADRLDPVYAKTLKEAKKAKVKITALCASMNKSKVSLNWENPIKTII